MYLLTTNKKLEKNSGYTIMGLNLAPHKVSGYNVCPHAGLCSEICIGEHSGFMKMPNVRVAQIRKTKLYFEDRKKFLELLHADLLKFEDKTDSLDSAVRLNVDSDIPWESSDRTLFDYNHTYYDYTKNPRRMRSYLNNKMPSNYYLTYSYSEKSLTKDLTYFLSGGANISIVFNVHYKSGNLLALPSTYKIGRKTYDVVDGDLHDLRIPQKDGSSVIVGLRAKMAYSKVAHYQKAGFLKG